MSEPTPEQVLSTPMGDNDAGVATIREYLIKLLEMVWDERECFDGKRPFGKSGWHWDLYMPLIRAGLVGATFDANGGVDEFDDSTANGLIFEAIRFLGRP